MLRVGWITLADPQQAKASSRMYSRSGNRRLLFGPRPVDVTKSARPLQFGCGSRAPAVSWGPGNRAFDWRSLH